MPISDSLQILVIEDEILVGMLVKDIITSLGHGVLGPLVHYEEALAAATQANVDFAVLDVDLDGKEIYPIADMLTHRQIPFVFCSGHGPMSIRASHRHIPMLQKPFYARQFKAMLAKVGVAAASHISQ